MGCDTIQITDPRKAGDFVVPDLKEVHELFVKTDTDGSGMIDCDELKRLLEIK